MIELRGGPFYKTTDPFYMLHHCAEHRSQPNYLHPSIQPPPSTMKIILILAHVHAGNIHAAPVIARVDVVPKVVGGYSVLSH